MAQDSASGGVPLGMKGVVVGISSKDIDIIWDRPFMGGETLGGRCSEYRGSIAPFSTCLNLTRPQFALDPAAASQGQNQGQGVNKGQFNPQFGPRPNVAPRNYQPSIPSNRPVSSIVRNPNSKPHPQASGDLPYGHAARGLRPQQAPAPAPSNHQNKLQTALLGHKAPALGGHVASRPAPLSPKSPIKALHGLPHVGHGNGEAGRGRGRGGAARGARGRGRGRGGAVVPVQNGQ
jgi:5'-3' exoribonuclease 1